MSERVLVLGDDSRAFLAVVRSLGRRGLEVHAAPADPAEPALASRYIVATHRLPTYALAPGAWEAALRRLIDDWDYRLIVPCGDSSLVQLHHHAGALDRARLALPNEEAFDAFTDKDRTRALAQRLGIPIADGRALAPDETAFDLRARYGLPLLLKPSRSYRIGDAADKRSARILRSAAGLERALAAGEGADCIVESYVPGEGVGVSVVGRAGRIVLAYQHRRLHQSSETGISTSRVAEPVDPQLLGEVEALAGAVALDGVAMFEFRCDRESGRHVLLEVNPRFWGSLPLALAAGADFPAILYDQVTGRAPGPRAGYRAGVVKRDFTGEYERRVDLSETAPSPLAKARWALAAVAVLLWRRGAADSWAADDPAPFRAERRQLAKRILWAALKRLSLPRPSRARQAEAAAGAPARL